ncbi:MAG: S-layer homology domain-containing protein [Clostridiales bacterium]|nr:S-layer homology domain-containing protein [Clostridiales bacterium]
MKKSLRLLGTSLLLSFALASSSMSVAAFADETDDTEATEETEETEDEAEEETETPEMDFSDVDSETEAGAAIAKMYENGYITGYTDGTFRPDGSITRAELVRIVNQTLRLERISEDTVSSYSDVEEAAWYYEDIIIAQEQGYVSGFPDGTFRPNENITREQFCTILSQFYSFSPLESYTEVVSDEISGWAEDYVYAVLSYGIMNLEDDNAFRATENITRGEVCLAMVNFIITDEGEVSDILSSIISDTESSSTGSSSSSSGSSSSGGGSSSGSSSSSSGSSSSSSSSSETTTESDSETTTDGDTETTTSSSSSGSSSSTTDSTTTTTETETETTTIDSETLAAVKSVYNSLQYAQINATNSSVKSFIKNIRAYLKSYMNDPSMDIDAAADDIISQYRSLSTEEKALAQDLILEYCSLTQLMDLKNTLLPNYTI